MEQTAINERILTSAEELFYRFGYSKTTAEDIARESSVSKRTLYKYYHSKNNLLEVLINNKMQTINKELNDIMSSDDLFPAKLHNSIAATTKVLSKISQHFFYDLKRNVPKVWQKILEYRKEIITTNFLSLLNEGIRTGYVRKNINRGTAVLIMISIIDNIINASAEEILPPNLLATIPQKTDKIFDEAINIIINGIFNDTALLELS